MVVVWRVTERCNLSCRFCAYDRELSRPRRESAPHQVRAFGALLADYQRATGDPVLVSWLGGEPLLWPPLSDLTRTFHTEHHLGISTTTNGTALGAPEVRAHLLEHYSELTISVDAVGPLHDQSRGWPGGYAALRRSALALAEGKRAAGHGPVLRANVLLMRETFPGFEQLCLELAEWGIEEITFNQLGGNDRPEFYSAHRLTPAQADLLAASLPTWRAALSARGVRLLGGEAYARRIQATARGVPLPVADCRPGTAFLFINESGRVSPCSFTVAGFSLPLGDVPSVEALRQLPVRLADARQRQRLPPCEDCHSTQVFRKFAA